MTATAVAPDEAPLAPGAELAPGYRVVALLSRNQALDVYDVWSEQRGCRCVAKVLQPSSRDNPRRRERLEREGELLARFTHPHIVRAYETVHEPELAVILETLSGNRLDHLIDMGSRRMLLFDVAMLGVQLCSAVSYLHGEGWLHLDLKPSNVIAQGGIAKVIDLSLARRPGPGRRRYGTREYEAPEQVEGADFSEATDVWGLGCVLFETLTRRRPFSGLGDDDDPCPQARHRAPSVRVFRRVPRALGDAIDACLSPAPSDRPSVAELAAACSEVTGV